MMHTVGCVASFVMKSSMFSSKAFESVYSWVCVRMLIVASCGGDAEAE